MLYRFTAFFASKRGIILAGAVIGLLAPLLQWLGNPPNMGVCVACFERDIAGALGLHSAAVVQYIRPEIIGFVLGSLLAAMAFKEFRARSGSAPIVRFVLGVFAMIGALAFLGCPWRALLRLSAGDLNAVVGIVGLALGIGVGVFFLRNGFNLGRSQRTYTGVGLVFPLLMVGLLVLAIFQPKFSENGPIFASESGPGAMHAPLLISLVVGLVIGALAQRTRFCTMGTVRDIILMRDFHLFWGIAALVA
ncbi:MAG: YedE-related selenium metabolism membrane protein, partial [Caldilineaceae bacterium]|nr:YedE-related selenium metabolism membrane protein [Caldilineaceae bacterium]